MELTRLSGSVTGWRYFRLTPIFRWAARTPREISSLTGFWRYFPRPECPSRAPLFGVQFLLSVIIPLSGAMFFRWHSS